MRYFYLIAIWATFGLSAQQDSTHVLFVGNSLTYNHEMPQMLQAMLRESGHPVRIHQSTVPGMSLQGHFTQIITFLTETTAFTRKKMKGEQTGTENALRGRPWDVIILQAGTVEAVIPEARTYSIGPAIASTKSYLERPSRIILFNTWASNGEYPLQYCLPANTIGQSLLEDQYCSPTFSNLSEHTASINSGFAELAAANGIEKSDNGELFLQVRTRYRDIELFDDAFHPSPAGSFLNACEFYFMLTGEKVSPLVFSGPLDMTEAAMLKQLVDRYHDNP